jgi:hypothetical protein
MALLSTPVRPLDTSSHQANHLLPSECLFCPCSVRQLGGPSIACPDPAAESDITSESQGPGSAQAHN